MQQREECSLVSSHRAPPSPAEPRPSLPLLKPPELSGCPTARSGCAGSSGKLLARAGNWVPGTLAKLAGSSASGVGPSQGCSWNRRGASCKAQGLCHSACPHSCGLRVPHVEVGMRPRAVSFLGTPVPARAPSSLSSLFGMTVSPACPVTLGGLSRGLAASAKGWAQTQPGLLWARGGKPAAGQ